MKKAFQALLILAIIGIIAYKAYDYFIKDKEEDVVDSEIIDELEDDFEEDKELSLAEKIKAAAKRVVG